MAELADLISVKDKSAIELFIRCVRKALWLAMLRGQLELGLWISSAILLLAGLINLFFYNISIYLSLIVALLPMVGVVFVAVKKMPTLANAASHADRLFKSKSLMTTATELLYSHKTVCRDFSPWIIQQAAHSAQRWHEQFKQSTAHKQHRFPWAAMGIALVGFFFILQPGVPDKHEVIKTEGNTVTADSKPALLSSLINEIKREENTLQNEALLSSPDELTEQVSSANPPALSNVDTHPQSNQKQAQVEDLSASINKENSPPPRQTLRKALKPATINYNPKISALMQASELRRIRILRHPCPKTLKIGTLNWLILTYRMVFWSAVAVKVCPLTSINLLIQISVLNCPQLLHPGILQQLILSIFRPVSSTMSKLILKTSMQKNENIGNTN